MSKKTFFEIVLQADSDGFSSSISKATKGLGAFNKSVDNSMRKAKDLDRGLASMAGKLTALFGGISTVALTKSIFDAGLSMDSLTRSFEAITGSSEAARAELDFVQQTADELGLHFNSTAEAYKSLAAAARGTTLEGKDTRDIFKGISEAAAVLGLSTDEAQGALLAIGQMISKGNVQAEELRGQLGERLPGAFQLAAKAMGVTTAELGKMLEQGQVAATDLLPKLAKVLHETYGQAALEASDSARAAVNRFVNAWDQLRVSIAQSGFLDVATGRLNDLTNIMKDPAVQQQVIALANNFFKLAESVSLFIVEHGKTLAAVGAGAVALSAISTTIHALIGAWTGLNTAMTIITGAKLIPYLSSLNIALTGTGTAALSASTALGVVAGAFLALKAGMAIGTKLYEWTEPTEKALKELQHELDTTSAKFKQFSTFQPESKESLFGKSTAELEAYKKKLVGLYQYQGSIVQGLYLKSKETTLFGNMTDGARQAEVELVAAREKLKQIEGAMDNLSAVWSRESAEMAESTKQASTVQKDETIKVTQEMQSAWQKYADKVKSLTDEIAGKQVSLTERLREMSRTGMSDYSAWKDLKSQANEYMQAAKLAAQAGNFDQALKYAEKAEDAYAELNNEVKDGEKVQVSQQTALKTAMQGVEAAGELAISIMEKQKQAAQETADAMNFESGWQLGEAFTDVGKAAQDLAEQAGTVGKKWQSAFADMKSDAMVKIKALDKALDEMARDREVQITVSEVQAHASGGMIRKFAAGGKLPGYGGGDRIPALLEAGEFVIRKEAVSKYGAAYLEALNSMRLNSADLIRARLGGLISQVQQVGVQRFNTGGLAGGETFNVNLALPGGKTVSLSGSGIDSQQVMRDLARAQRLRSA